MRNLIGKKGFTLIEVILVVVIMFSVLGMGILYYQSSQVRTDLNSQVSSFVSYLRYAQSNALAGKYGESHGIHIETDSFTTFAGGSYDVLDERNFSIQLPPSVMFQNVNLNGGGPDVIFDSVLGETENYGTLELASSAISEVMIITITKYGNVSY